MTQPHFLIAPLSFLAMTAATSAQTASPEIAFVENGLKVMAPDGTNVRTVLTLRSGESVGRPVWSADGTQLAFSARIGTTWGIYTVRVDGTGLQRVTTQTQAAVSPCVDWSVQPGPGGKRMICYIDNSPNTTMPMQGMMAWDVFVVNPDGTGKVNVSRTNMRNESSCAFTRNGNEVVAYGPGPVGSGYSEMRRYTLGLDGTGAVVPTGSESMFCTTDVPSGGTPYQPRYANLSDNFVCFVASTSGYRAIYWGFPSPYPPSWLLLSGGTVSQDDGVPCLSPDDLRICFARMGQLGSGIYVAAANGTNQVRIRTTGTAPAWKRP